MKVIITRTDRCIFENFDLRSKKLYSIRYTYFLLMDENNDLVSYYINADFYNNKNNLTNLKNIYYFRKSDEKEKNNVNKFIKFAKKHGKVIEMSLEDYNKLFENEDKNFIPLKQELKDLNNKVNNLLNNLRKIEGKDKKGRWKKCNIPNLIMVNHQTENAFISDERTHIIRKYYGYSYGRFKIEEADVDYWGYSCYLSSNSNSCLYPDSFTIYKAGKKGIKSFMELMEERNKIHNKIGDFNKKIIEKLFT